MQISITKGQEAFIDTNEYDDRYHFRETKVYEVNRRRNELLNPQIGDDTEEDQSILHD